MSWPDNQPRFVVHVVSGYAINPRAASVGSERKHVPICAAVLDRAYAYRIICEFTSTGFGNQKPDDVRRRANAYAATLNAAEDAAEHAA